MKSATRRTSPPRWRLPARRQRNHSRRYRGHRPQRPGSPLETYRHRGRLYVAGTPGNRYAVSVRNRSGGRILTVISVDGVNAVTGETAAAGQSGYVLAAGQGGRGHGLAQEPRTKSPPSTSHACRDSYAARTDRPENVGRHRRRRYSRKTCQPLGAPPAQLGAQREGGGLRLTTPAEALPVPPPRPRLHLLPRPGLAPAMASASHRPCRADRVPVGAAAQPG